MKTQIRLATILVVLACFGCKGPAETSAVSAAANNPTANPSGEGASGASSSDGATRVEYIKDPTLNNMNAIPVRIPAKWHFQGTLFQGGNCSQEPYSVYRATSPDGLSYVEALPAMGWVWGTGPMVGFMPKDGCLPLKGPMSAQQFLKYLAATMHMEYVADDPVSAEENAKAQKYVHDFMAGQANPPKQTAELAHAIVRYKNGTFVMSGFLQVNLLCRETVSRGAPSVSAFTPGQPIHVVNGPPSTVDTCDARAAFLTGPESQFAALRRQWTAPGMGKGPGTEEWQDAWTNRTRNRVQAQTARDNQNAAQQRQAQQQQFEHSMAVQQQMHNEFLATMQRGTDMSMQRTQDAMNARSTATSDWVDYSLDRQTVLDPSSGQLTKVSSTYSQTWIDSTGKVSYQTNDPNANPNGVLPGVWNQQAKVHGDGSQ